MAFFFAAGAASAICPYPNGGQFECHTTGVDTDETIFDVASLYHANPVRVCDYNSHALSASECYGKIALRKNFTLRVPQGSCVPMPGILCYEVKDDKETLESIAYSDTSVFRSTDLIIHHNKHTMWGQNKLFKGMHLRLPNPLCIPDLGNPNEPLICHTVKKGEDLRSITSFYETNEATVQKYNTERLGPYPFNRTIAVGMQLQIPHPYPNPDPNKPCAPDKWGHLWSCYTVHSKANRSRNDAVPVDDDLTDDDQAIDDGIDLYEIAQITFADPWKICELNPWIDCSPAFYCNGTTPGLNKCSVFIQPSSVTGKALTIAHTECTPPSDNAYSCYQVPIDNLPYSDLNKGVEESYPRYTAPNLLSRGPSPTVFNYAEGSGPDIAVAWYQTYIKLNAHALAKTQAIKGGPDLPPDPRNCLVSNADGTFKTINDCYYWPGMHIKIPNIAACATADPNACYTLSEQDAEAAKNIEEHCVKNNYSAAGCKWNGGNAMSGLFINPRQSGGIGRNMMGEQFFSADSVEKFKDFDYSSSQCPYPSSVKTKSEGCPTFIPENTMQSLGGHFTYGLQFKIPQPKLVPAGGDGDHQYCGPILRQAKKDAGHLSDDDIASGPLASEVCEACKTSGNGCAAVPDTSLPLNECVDVPGKHWCYRLQTYGKNSDNVYTGDYLWNVSQNVPSVPIPCTVDSTGKPIDCQLCPDGVYNCNIVAPLSAVEIPIGRPPPPTPSPPVEVWQGTFSFPGLVPGTWLAHSIPINISVDTNTSTATVEWTWAVLSSGAKCVPQKESGLKVSTGGQKWFARGTGADPQYYSLVANLTNGETLSDGIIYKTKDGTWPAPAEGTFSAKKNAPRPSWQCPRNPAPSPAPPKPKAKQRHVWPAPASFTKGSTNLTLASDFQFKFASSKTPRSHYEDPKDGCSSDEKALTEKVTGVTGTICSPQCATQVCPTDVPPGVTAKPKCFTDSSAGTSNCFLVCTPGSAGDASCGASASCKDAGGVSGTGGSGAYYDTGVCTYDDDSSASALALNITFIAKQ
jgi:hypothetical protein